MGWSIVNEFDTINGLVIIIFQPSKDNKISGVSFVDRFFAILMPQIKVI
jgi:hypothetical protein